VFACSPSLNWLVLAGGERFRLRTCQNLPALGCELGANGFSIAVHRHADFTVLPPWALQQLMRAVDKHACSVNASAAILVRA